VSNLITLKRPALSASEVKTNIEQALHRAAEVDANNIKVTVEKYKVILNRKVSSWVELDEAERAAWSAPGVNEVLDHLEVVLLP
jgi:osmotically-inducible protein OsmY